MQVQKCNGMYPRTLPQVAALRLSGDRFKLQHLDTQCVLATCGSACHPNQFRDHDTQVPIKGINTWKGFSSKRHDSAFLVEHHCEWYPRGEWDRMGGRILTCKDMQSWGLSDHIGMTQLE